MKRLFLYIPVFCLVLLEYSFQTHQEISPVKLLTQMMDSIRNIKTLRVKIYALERIEKSFLSANSEIKLQTNPRKLYFKNPAKKLEILYGAGENNGKAVVKPHVFPYMTILLDPTGNMMRKNQHYSIHELGYDFIGKSVALTLNKDKEGMKNFTYHGITVKNGSRCHFLEYENKGYAYVKYTVGEHETVTSIANKNCVNDYLVRYTNDLVNDFGFLKKGRVIQIPNLYCKKATIYLDENFMLPISISLYDDKGIFENYEFSGLQKNKGILPEEFTRKFPDYHF